MILSSSGGLLWRCRSHSQKALIPVPASRINAMITLINTMSSGCMGSPWGKRPTGLGVGQVPGLTRVSPAQVARRKDKGEMFRHTKGQEGSDKKGGSHNPPRSPKVDDGNQHPKKRSHEHDDHSRSSFAKHQ